MVACLYSYLGLDLNPILSDFKDYALSLNLNGTTKSRDTIPIIVHVHSAFQIAEHAAAFFLLCPIPPQEPVSCLFSILSPMGD